jgi:hypothetical protein
MLDLDEITAVRDAIEALHSARSESRRATAAREAAPHARKRPSDAVDAILNAAPTPLHAMRALRMLSPLAGASFRARAAGKLPQLAAAAGLREDSGEQEFVFNRAPASAVVQRRACARAKVDSGLAELSKMTAEWDKQYGTEREVTRAITYLRSKFVVIAKEIDRIQHECAQAEQAAAAAAAEEQAKRQAARPLSLDQLEVRAESLRKTMESLTDEVRILFSIIDAAAMGESDGALEALRDVWTRLAIVEGDALYELGGVNRCERSIIVLGNGEHDGCASVRDKRRAHDISVCLNAVVLRIESERNFCAAMNLPNRHAVNRCSPDISFEASFTSSHRPIAYNDDDAGVELEDDWEIEVIVDDEHAKKTTPVDITALAAQSVPALSNAAPIRTATDILAAMSSAEAGKSNNAALLDQLEGCQAVSRRGGKNLRRDGRTARDRLSARLSKTRKKKPLTLDP